MAPPFTDPDVERVFAGFPGAERAGLLALRRLIFQIAARTAGVGALQEMLKMGPARLSDPRDEIRNHAAARPAETGRLRALCALPDLAVAGLPPAVSRWFCL